MAVHHNQLKYNENSNIRKWDQLRWGKTYEFWHERLSCELFGVFCYRIGLTSKTFRKNCQNTENKKDLHEPWQENQEGNFKNRKVTRGVYNKPRKDPTEVDESGEIHSRPRKMGIFEVEFAIWQLFFAKFANSLKWISTWVCCGMVFYLVWPKPTSIPFHL